MSYEEIRYEVEAGVLTLTLNRPERLNAFTSTMGHELIDAFDRADADDDVRAVVVTGAGRGFCAGADLGAGGETFDWRRRGDGADEVPRDTRRAGDAAHLRLRQAGDRRHQRAGGGRRGHDDAADGRAPGRLVRRRWASCSRVAGSCPRPARAGSCRASWASARRWSGWPPGASSTPRRRWRAGWRAACTSPGSCMGAAVALAREIADQTAPVSVALSRRMLWTMLGAEHPMLAHRADSRGMLVPRPVRRRARGRHLVPGEAPGGLPRPRERRPARSVPGPAGARV